MSEDHPRPSVRAAVDDDFFPRSVTVATAGPLLSVKHLFIPCLFIHSSGHYLIVCRWDGEGSEEGDATNEQALYFSLDQGTSWVMANDGHALITLAQGTSFDQPSSITGAWLFEDRAGIVWAYYTINQPFTWGADRPDRSTGGGEIRRVRLNFDGQTWRAAPRSEIIWAFRRPLTDGRGGLCDDIRLISWNGLLRTSRGTLLMPVGGRSTVDDPQGAFWKLNRVWMLESEDEGRTWPRAYFVAGNDSRCFAEPTIVETGTPGEIVCLLRMQYGTGDQLHRSVSGDYGVTWSEPVPTGLPNANQHGVKPFLRRTRDGRYVLLQTNEHTVIERTNLAIFRTDAAGLLADRWPELKTLDVRNRSGWWPGACYGWLEEDPKDGSICAAFPRFDDERSFIVFMRLDQGIFARCAAVEPNGVIDEKGDHLPRLSEELTPDGVRSFRFKNCRGRLIATRFGQLTPTRPFVVRFAVRVARAGKLYAFPLLSVRARNGRVAVADLLLGPGGLELQVDANPAGRAWASTLGDGKWHRVECRFPDAHHFELCVDPNKDSCPMRFYTKTTARVTTLLWGGRLENPEDCEIYLGDFSYFEE